MREQNSILCSRILHHSKISFRLKITTNNELILTKRQTMYLRKQEANKTTIFSNESTPKNSKNHYETKYKQKHKTKQPTTQTYLPNHHSSDTTL